MTLITINTYDAEDRLGMNEEQVNEFWEYIEKHAGREGYETRRTITSARGSETHKVDEFSEYFVENLVEKFWDEKRDN